MRCYVCCRRHAMNVSYEWYNFTDRRPRKNTPISYADDRSLRTAKKSWSTLTHSEYVVVIIIIIIIIIIITKHMTKGRSH